LKPFSLVALALFALVSGAVCLRMLRLAARTRRPPELFLGLSFLFQLGGYLVMVAGAAWSLGPPSRSVVEAAAIPTDLGFVAEVAFVWIVFRREEGWARALACLLALGCLAMPVVNHFVPWPDGVPSAAWPRAAVRTACHGWAAVEALRYARLMRKRVRFGLAEPVVADRFFLWGLGSASAALMQDTLTAGGALYVRQAQEGHPLLWIGATFGLIAAVAFGLSFFPPAAYARYVARRMRAEAAS
jgi:hypothetical protein